jgi:hypothetical protein
MYKDTPRNKKMQRKNTEKQRKTHLEIDRRRHTASQAWKQRKTYRKLHIRKQRNSEDSEKY